MRRRSEGMTFVELLISIVIMSFVTVAASALFSVCLKAYAHGASKSALYREGLFVMERMTSGVRRTTLLTIPNAHAPTRPLLVFSAGVNEDGDYYFGDPLFPRVDEDVSSDMNKDSRAGLEEIDDDGNGSTDEGSFVDDDEDGLVDEELWIGIDDDGDGNIDEDVSSDMNQDGHAGIKGVDDNADGIIDNGGIPGAGDDDEDGLTDEDPTNPIAYSVSGTSLIETRHWSGKQVALASRATNFSVTYEPPDATHAPRVLISLTLTTADGESVTFSEYVYPRNILQRTGKRVR